MTRIGLIGYGAVGTAIAENWAATNGSGAQLAAILVRSNRVSSVQRAHPSARVTATLDEFIAMRPQVVIEAAGHDALIQLGEPVLRAGIEIHILSAGALADDALAARLVKAAQDGRARIIILAGALAGFDGLRSMRASGLISLKYTSIKPVMAWRATIADEMFELDALTGPQIIFSGTAREAANAFPQNANLAAAVAIAGLGFEKTQVEMIADPNVQWNIGRIEAVANDGTLDLTLSGSGFPGNPKTSRITAMSALASIKNLEDSIAFF